MLVKIKKLTITSEKSKQFNAVFFPKSSTPQGQVIFSSAVKTFFASGTKTVLASLDFWQRRKRPTLLEFQPLRFQYHTKHVPPLTFVILFGEALLDTLALQPPLGDQDEHCLLASTQQ